ncbi:MAG: hypothetical protein ACJ763_01240 [Bdellovibrionia bacterium]
MNQSKMALLSLAPSLLMMAVFGSLSALSASSVRAEEMSVEEHPCGEYIKHCKAKDLTPGHGLWKCVAKEAKKSNNEVCMAKLKEGAKHMHNRKMHQSESAPTSQKEAE